MLEWPLSGVTQMKTLALDMTWFNSAGRWQVRTQRTRQAEGPCHPHPHSAGSQAHPEGTALAQQCRVGVQEGTAAILVFSECHCAHVDKVKTVAPPALLDDHTPATEAGERRQPEPVALALSTFSGPQERLVLQRVPWNWGRSQSEPAMDCSASTQRLGSPWS